MSSIHLPANGNEAPFLGGLQAAWPGATACVAAWSTLAHAGVSNWLLLQEALLEAAGDLSRMPLQSFDPLPVAGDAPAIDAIAAAVEDVRDCREAVMQAQIDAFDAFDALRQSA